MRTTRAATWMDAAASVAAAGLVAVLCSCASRPTGVRVPVEAGTVLSMFRGEMSLGACRQLRADYADDTSKELFLEYLAQTCTEAEMAVLDSSLPRLSDSFVQAWSAL